MNLELQTLSTAVDMVIFAVICVLSGMCIQSERRLRVFRSPRPIVLSLLRRGETYLWDTFASVSLIAVMALSYIVALSMVTQPS